jgi:DNA-binding MarR family transcriptional regulator
MSALADLTALTNSAITRIVARLEHRTWVLRTRAPKIGGLPGQS